MNKEEVLEILKKENMNYSSQFVEFILKYNSKDLLLEFIKYWKNKPAGGGDLNNFFNQHYTKRLGD